MILVTGSTGFVGINLLVKLSKNRVVALYRNDRKKSLAELYLRKKKVNQKNIHWKKCDITKISNLEEVFDKITHVYHCAGLVSFSISDTEKLRKVNIIGTENIVNLCIENKIKKLVYVSSISTLGNESNEIDETLTHFNYNQNTPYSFSKYKGEMEVWRGIEEGLKAVIINPGVIMGKYYMNDSPESKIEKMITRYPICLFTEGETGFVNLNDVIDASIQLMESNITGERFILVSKNFSYKNLIKKLKQRLNQKSIMFCVRRPILLFLFYFDLFLSTFYLKKRYMNNGLIQSFVNRKKYNGTKITRYIKEFKYTEIF